MTYPAPIPPHPPGSAWHFREGETARDFTDATSGLRGLVIRGPFSGCGYVGAPNAHPLHGVEELEFECHFGITYSGQGDGQHRPANYCWWGWDYGHFTDHVIMPPELDHLLKGSFFGRSHGKDWTVDEVAEDVLDVLMSLRAAISRNSALARKILLKAMPG